MKNRILVLDDDEGTRDVLQTALTDESFIVETLGTSERIMEEIGIFQPDLVLLDYLITPFKGDEVCKKIQSNPATRQIPLIMISAYPNVSKISTDCRCSAFIDKPFDLWKAVDLIRNIVSQ